MQAGKRRKSSEIPTDPSSTETADGADEVKRARWWRRHPIASSLLSVVGLLLVGLLGFAWWLNSSLGDIQRVPLTLNEEVRPTPSGPDDVNLLFLGTDAGSERNQDGADILADAASGNWPTGKYRSDATMIVHIPGDRSNVTVMSIPRDSYVPIYDSTGLPVGNNKINAALSLHGPSGAVSTVENLTGVRIDHIAMIDWDGFRAITNAVGGVTMTTDTGTSEYNGQQALDYVRERYSVAGGDFGRIDRQQNYLRALMAQLMSSGTVTNPVTLSKTVSSITSNVAVDDQWSNGDIRSLALSMRSLRPADVRFITVPVAGTGTDPVAGSIVLLEENLFGQLFDSVNDGTLSQFLETHSELGLPESSAVD